MPKTTKKQVRALWLQVHKWIGLVLAVLIIPISLTGSALVWHDWLDAQLNPARHAALGPATLPPSTYAAAAARALAPGQLLSSLHFDPDGAPVTATALQPAKGEGRPQRTSIWLDPRDASVIDKASADAGFMRTMHMIHGSLLMQGGWGRPIVGWVGAFMFVSCLTGIWLWWPLSGSVTSGFKWKRRNTLNANLHYMAGFWILIPLAMLSFTGAWISFPKVFGVFESGPPQRGPDRGAALRAKPLALLATPVDKAVAAARPLAQGALTNIAWPTKPKPNWAITFTASDGAQAEIAVADADAAATPPGPAKSETLARLMRRLHDGEDMGPIWQTVIVLGGIIPALLSVTGIVIWWRARRTRRRSKLRNDAMARSAGLPGAADHSEGELPKDLVPAAGIEPATP